MASQAYEQILAVQALDLSLRQLRHRHLTHPARAEVDSLQAERSVEAAARDELAEQHHSLERDRKRFEDEASQLEDKRTQLDAKLYGGEVTATKELLAIQDEMANLVDRRNAVEDEELVVMEQLEDVTERLSEVDARLAAIDERLARSEAVLADGLAEVDAEIKQVESDRIAAVAPASPDLLARYEDLRDQFDGVAVARLVGGACDGCHISVSAVAVDQMAKMDDDEVVTCEECGRLLVR